METKTLDQLTPEQVADLERLKSLIKKGIQLQLEDHGRELRAKRISEAAQRYVEAADNADRDSARAVIERECDAGQRRYSLENALMNFTRGKCFDEIRSKYGEAIRSEVIIWAQQFYNGGNVAIPLPNAGQQQ